METSKKSKQIYSQIERMLPEWLFHPEHEELRRISHVAYPTVFIAVFVLIIIGVIRLLQHHTALGIIEVSFAIVLAGLLLYYSKTKAHDNYLVAYLGIAAFGMFAIYLFFFNKYGSHHFIWSLTFPLMVFPILGSLRGRVAVILFIVPIFLLLSVNPALSFMVSYPRSFVLPYIVSILTVSTLSYLYESNRERDRQQLKLANNALQRSKEEMEQQVQQRTAELAQSEKNYRFLTERTSDIIWTADLNLIVTYVTPSVTRILGFTPEEYKKRPFHERVTPETFDKAMRIVADLEREKMPATDPERNLQLEAEFYHKGGSTVWMDILVTAVRDDQGNLIGIHGVSRDITERKKMEEAKKESEELFAQFMRHFPGSAYIKDSDRRIIYLTDNVESRFGVQHDEWLGKTSEEIWPSDIASAVRQHDEAALQGKVVQSITERPQKGKLHTWITHRFPIQRQNKPPLIGCISIDITARVKAEEALRESEEKYRSLAATADNMYLVDRECRYLFMNEMHLSRLGVSLDEIVGKSYANLHSEEDARKFSENVERVFEAGESFQSEHKSKRDDRYFIRTFSPVISSQGNITAVTVISKDITDRKRAEEALKKSELRFKHLAEIFPETIFESDLEGNLTYANEHAYERFGYTEEDFSKGLNIMDMVAPEDRHTLMSRIRERIEGKKGGYQEYLALRKDGVTFPALGYSASIMHDGCPIGLRGFILDISKRKQAEEALRESEGKYRFITERMSDVIWTLDSGFRVQYVTPSVLKALGFTPEERAKLTIFERITPESFKKVEEVLEFEMQRERQSDTDPDRTVTLELEYYHKNGSTVWHETIISGIRDVEGNIIGFHGSSRDITDRKRAEQSLRESEEKYRSVFDNATVGINLKLPGGTFLEANQSLINTLGYSREELNDLSFLDITHPDDVQISGEKHDSLKRGDIDTYRIEKRYLGKNGRVIWVDTSVRALRDSLGKLLATVGVIADITQRKRAEEKLQASLQEKETLLKEIHHRVKNNLQVISSLLSLQSQHTKDKGDLEIFRASENRVRTMALVHNMLYQSETLSAIDYGSFIRELVGVLLHAYRTDPSAIKINLDVHDTQLDIVKAVPCGLILNELISNALKHAFPGDAKGEVSLRMRADDDRIVMRLQDTGIGFPETLDFRNSQSLGLQLVNILVEQINGTIELMANGGTTFTITFPITSMNKE